eukprot:TRINITY_DN6375_c0_g1_i2.p1 TRINITY_DN6375_c0_g1~~TRINITY_DN6375_c0_g1_i2.p1  ORF type:complete len:830 (+),score=168.25 TRINITY_DN6375_c0_g1_i2:36-2525(+)
MDLMEGWALLRDRYYRKMELYEMSWENVDLNRLRLVGGPLGGPIAATRDDSKLQRVTSATLKPTIDVYSSSGVKLSSFIWDKGHIVKMAWDDIERLVVVLDDGTIALYNVFGDQLKRIPTKREEIRQNRVRDAYIWSGGVVMLTHNLQFFCTMNFDDPFTIKLRDPGLVEPPTCWTVIEPQLTENNSVQVLVGTVSGTILTVDANQVQDMLAPNGPFLAISVAPTGKLLACFTKTGSVWVVSADFAQNLSSFETGLNFPPYQFAWCGIDAVVAVWGAGEDWFLFAIGPFANFLKYTYREPLTLVPEPDGIRIVSGKKCELLQRVPTATEAIFRAGADTPGATLYAAFEAYEKNDPQSDEKIRAIAEDLGVAIDQTIDAASHEFDPIRQRSLLKAASLGKAFKDFYMADHFVEVCKNLRILNQLRDFRLGMPLTYPQFKLLGPELLVERLVGRHQHLLAFQVCEYLGLKTDKVLIHWACTKVRVKGPGLPDDDMALRSFVSTIANKLQAVPGISYAEIAWAAYEQAQKPKLATLLLDFEPRAQEQVPMLIRMRQAERALEKAIQSGDTDLVHLVILHLRRDKSREQFFDIISKHEVALSLYIRYCKEQDMDKLRELYKHQGKSDMAAYTYVKEAYAPASDPNTKRENLRTALTLYKQNNSYAAKATEEQIGLLLTQRDLEISLGGQFVGSSVSSTIYRCILMGDSKRASKIASDFKVPDNRFWWLKVKALAELGDFEELEKFSKEKKPPIGFKPFADVCIDAGNVNEAVKYIRKISQAEVRARLFIRIKNWREAFVAAKDAKNPSLLMTIRNACKDPPLQEQIDDALRSV